MYDKNMSEDRKKYLRKIRKNKISVILTQLLILIIFINISGDIGPRPG